MNTDLLDNAKSLITGPRNESYGSFTENVTRMQMLMEALTYKSYTRHEIRSFFLALKLCRHDGKSFTEDTLADMCGYSQLIHNDQKESK